jgi:zinc transporter ZupT
VGSLAVSVTTALAIVTAFSAARQPGTALAKIGQSALECGARASTDASELAWRMRWVQRLLYASSLLFVAGIMMSRANFTWILAHWDTSDEKVSKALGEVIRAGVMQSGVGYSALLVAFFVPTRTFLALLVDPLTPPEACADAEARKRWLAAQNLAGSWQADARQILALLAPVLSAPVFDAIAKVGSSG